MRIEIKTPELSESVQTATLLEWRRQVGERVARDEVLADLETDKVILEVTAPGDGVLSAIQVPAGGEAQAGAVLAYIESAGEGENLAGVEPMAEAPAVTAASEPEAPPPIEALTPRPEAAPPLTCAPRSPATGQDQPRQRREPMSRLRQRIAERMVEAQHTAAILTTFNEIDMRPVQDLRRRFQERFQQQHGVKLGFMSFFVKAACQALKQYPVINAAVEGRDIVYHDYFDIGVAVSTERGLVVPVLRDAERLTFAEIERRIVDFAQRAAALKLGLEELAGGTFTLTNGGVFGSLLSTPILNPPQSAVLGLHRIQDRPVAEDGQVVIRPMMYVALSYDHRIIDGREAVSFLKAVKDDLEDPGRLLLEL